MKTPSRPEKKDLILWGILGLAFCLRVAGVQFGLPHLYHADEPIVVNHAMAYGSGDLNPHFFKIPPLMSYLVFLLYSLYFAIGRGVGIFKSLGDFEFLFYGDPTPFYLLARLIFGVLLGTLTVYLFYRLIAKAFSQETALLSAFLLGICFLHVRDSHYLYADIPLALVMVLTFFAIFEVFTKGENLKPHLVSGLMIGWAAATKYNGLSLVIPYLFASLSLREKRRLPSFWILAGLGAAAVFMILNPYSLLDFGFFVEELKRQSQSHGSSGWLHHLEYSLAGGVGVPLLAAGLMGLGRIGKEKSCLAVFVVGYYLLISLAGQPYDRYVLPLVPFLIFFAADFTLWFSQRFKRQRLVLTTLILLMALPNLAKSILFDRVMTAKDTRTLAKEWVERNIPAGSNLALGWDFYMPRLAFVKNQLLEKKEEVLQEGFHSEGRLRKLDYLLTRSTPSKPSYHLFFLLNDPEKNQRPLFAKPGLPYDLDLLKDRGIDYVIVARVQKNQEPAHFYDQLARQASLEIEFNPYRHPQPWPLDPQPLTGGPFLFRDLFLRERNGQIIQIYRLK